MYNLIMGCTGVVEGRASLPVARMFEYTPDDVKESFKTAGAIDLDALRRLPCLFIDEGTGNDQIARIGRVTAARIDRNDVRFEVAFEHGMPALRNSGVGDRAADFGIFHDFEFSRTHWAVKDVDLYRAVILAGRVERSRPTVFTIPEHEKIDQRQLSVMMPFGGQCAGVYDAIKDMAIANGLKCNRADDICENDHILADIVSLIDRSRIVIIDLSGKNPNVLYEAGIAHTLGRQTILLTQNADDVPFDLKPIRYIDYLNNAEGRDGMVRRLLDRIGEILDG